MSKHLRSQASRNALESLRQARRCEQYVVRLEMKVKKEATKIHLKLNEDANRCIIKAAEEGQEWQEDLVLLLGKPENKGGDNVMIIPHLRGLLENCINYSKPEGKKQSKSTK